MKIKSFALHQIELNDYAATEHWYRTYHGPELARRYGPWLDRFESYRPVPAPPEAQAYGLTNYLCTVGIWDGLPEEGDRGELALTSPKVHARPFHFIGPVQCSEDFKGRDWEPTEKNTLRWVQLFRWPEGQKQAAEDWFLHTFAPAACEVESLYRFFSYQALTEDIHLPGHWKQGTESHMKGKPEDHRWDRLVEMWFEDYEEWNKFCQSALPKPAWATHPAYPFVVPGEDYRSCFLLENPAYRWLDSRHCYK